MIALSDLYEYIKSQANIVRNIGLEDILIRSGSTRDNQDKAKWHTSRGIISVIGSKFINWKLGSGGGGAIDLIMHLKHYDFKTAVSWLTANFTYDHSHCVNTPFSKYHIGVFEPPQRDNKKLYQIRNYLFRRCIPTEYIDALINSEKLYADHRGNAVFLLLGKDKFAVGAELRGTGLQKWRGMAPGSKKKQGCFFVNRQNCRKVVLCESAIDAISYSVLHPDCITLSTSGAIDDHPWIKIILKKNYQVQCGFDADEAGDYFATNMKKRYPSIKRTRPALKDWNDVLKMKFKYQQTK